jgi:hypothetical protein
MEKKQQTLILERQSANESNRITAVLQAHGFDKGACLLCL